MDLGVISMIERVPHTPQISITEAKSLDAVLCNNQITPF